MLEFLKTFLTVLIPLGLNILVGQLSQWCRNAGKPLYEPSVIPGQAQETPNLIDIGGALPFYYRFNLARVN